jgi:DNA-3-methyladenine glycosylase II
MQRVVSLMQCATPEKLMGVADQDLRDAGFSWRKIEYAKGLAEAVHKGDLDIEGLENMSDEEAIKAITNLRGVVRWSAEIYLMFSLQRKDIFPADDLGLLVGLGKLKGIADKPTPRQAREIVKHWAPWRSVGSLFLWQYYHHDYKSG